MTLTPGALSTFQRCPRQWLLNQSGEPRRWRPKSLFSRLFRAAILKLSQGQDLRAASDEAACQFLETAAKPGIECHGSPFLISRDYCAILRTSLARVHACHIPPLKQGPSILLSEQHKWLCGAFIAQSGGALYSWTVVESLNDLTLSRELHSWHVFGDCAATGLPMQLNVLEIGRQSGDHQHTPWCRAYRHPAIAGRFAFQNKDGKALSGDWKPVYYQDSLRNDPETWIRLMERDRVNALKLVPVQQVKPEHARQFKTQVCAEADRMEAMKSQDWRQVPMSRPTCDLPPCSWQAFCYS